jgi:MarR family transcriptional regulator, organic hydroperoxide resistance regulator
MPDQISRAVAIFETMQSLRRIFKALQNYSHEVSHRYGITGPQLWVLKTVFKDGELPLGELSQKMYLHPSTITGVVNRLEKKGYVSRDRDQEDRRVVMVQLTPKGKRLVKRAPNPVQGKMIHGLRQLRKEKLEFIHESVQTLVEIMEAQNLKVTFFFDRE